MTRQDACLRTKSTVSPKIRFLPAARRTRRGSEIIVMGGPRRVRLSLGKRPIFGDTVDFVLKHAPCRVMVAAGRDEPE